MRERNSGNLTKWPFLAREFRRDHTALRPMRSLLVFLVLVFAVGAWLAPWLYVAAHWAAGFSTFFQKIAAHPFHRFVNRALLLTALLGLWPFLRSLGVHTWADIGLINPRGHWWRLRDGFIEGLISLAVVVLLAMTFGARTWNGGLGAGDYARQLVSAGATAMAVSLLEELLFRGALFGSLRKTFPWPVALLISSVFFALVHFFQRPASPAEVNWASGFQVLAQMLQGFGDWKMLVPGFLTLTLVGIILGLGYQRTGNLFYSIGLHAGWIFWLQSYNFLTRPTTEASTWFWGSQKMIDGWLAALVLSALAIYLGRRWQAMKYETRWIYGR